MTPTSALAGLGLKPAQLDAALAHPTAIDFVEIHAENAMVPGGRLRRSYERMRAQWPMSVHGVGLSIGGSDPLDQAHLERLAGVVEWLQPAWVSEHLAWSSHGGVFYADLLPLPYDAAALRRVCAHVDQVQQRLGRRLMIENPSTYFCWASSSYDEAGFLCELVRRTGCGLLVDVNNAHVSAVNNGGDAGDLLDRLPATAIGEIHLAGHTVEVDAAGDPLLIDTHGAAIADPVWDLYRRLLDRIGPRATLIERDRDVPALADLLGEVGQACHLLRTMGRETRAAA